MMDATAETCDTFYGMGTPFFFKHATYQFGRLRPLPNTDLEENDAVSG